MASIGASQDILVRGIAIALHPDDAIAVNGFSLGKRRALEVYQSTVKANQAKK
jgi:hypothetical protein